MNQTIERETHIRSFVANGRFLAVALSLLLLAGCRTGALADFYAYNPLNRQGPEEHEYGPSPAARRAEIRATAERIRRMPPAEQMALAADLALDMQNETDPIVRADIVLALGKTNTEAAQQALRMAMHDAETNVKIAACEAWRDMGGPDAIDALSQVLTDEPDSDVRLAATRALGAFQDPAAVRALSVALEDHNAALQYRAMESLKQASGRDLGHDVVAWREYVQNTSPDVAPRSGPTLVERFRDRF